MIKARCPCQWLHYCVSYILYIIYVFRDSIRIQSAVSISQSHFRYAEENMFEEFRREKIWGGAKMGANVDRTLSIKKHKLLHNAVGSSRQAVAKNRISGF